MVFADLGCLNKPVKQTNANTKIFLGKSQVVPVVGGTGKTSEFELVLPSKSFRGLRENSVKTFVQIAVERMGQLHQFFKTTKLPLMETEKDEKHFVKKTIESNRIDFKELETLILGCIKKPIKPVLPETT